jgi:hypothetical protein
MIVGTSSVASVGLRHHVINRTFRRSSLESRARPAPAIRKTSHYRGTRTLPRPHLCSLATTQLFPSIEAVVLIGDVLIER